MVHMKSSILESRAFMNNSVVYTRNFTIFDQTEATIPLFIYKAILKHQEKEIHHVFKEEQAMVCSSPF